METIPKFDINMLNENINEAIDFYRGYNRVIDLWQVNGDAKKCNQENQLIDLFRIRAIKDNLIANIDSTDGIRDKIDFIKERTGLLIDDIGNIIDENEKQLPQNVIEALDIILNQVERFQKAFKERSSKVVSVLDDEETTLNAHTESLVELLRKTIGNLIEETLSAIYRGMKMTPNTAYDICLEQINLFLQSIGVYTYELYAGDKINFDYCSYSDDGTDEDTDDASLDDVIIEIKQLPYLLSDTNLISSAKVSTWRFKK